MIRKSPNLRIRGKRNVFFSLKTWRLIRIKIPRLSWMFLWTCFAQGNRKQIMEGNAQGDFFCAKEQKRDCTRERTKESIMRRGKRNYTRERTREQKKDYKRKRVRERILLKGIRRDHTSESTRERLLRKGSQDIIQGNALGNVFCWREQKRDYKGTQKLTYFAQKIRRDSTRESTRERISLTATEIYYTRERITEGIKREGIVQGNVEGHVFWNAQINKIRFSGKLMNNENLF